MNWYGVSGFGGGGKQSSKTWLCTGRPSLASIYRKAPCWIPAKIPIPDIHIRGADVGELRFKENLFGHLICSPISSTLQLERRGGLFLLVSACGLRSYRKDRHKNDSHDAKKLPQHPSSGY